MLDGFTVYPISTRIIIARLYFSGSSQYGRESDLVHDNNGMEYQMKM